MFFQIKQALSLLILATMANGTIFSLSLKAQTTSVSPEAGCIREPQNYIPPELMATMAYRGTFKEEGIPGGVVFETEFNAGNITAAKIVQAAIKACILSNKYGLGDHSSYIEEVKNQIQLDIREDGDDSE